MAARGLVNGRGPLRRSGRDLVFKPLLPQKSINCFMKTNEVNKWLLEVEHPAKGDKNIVELGMVEKIEAEDGKVVVTLGF